jgi:phosphoglycerate kinase
MFTKQTIRNINISGKRVLLRAELDAPLNTIGTQVTSDFRLLSNIPTLKALLQADCSIIIIGKLGRPGGKPDPTMSLKPVAERLQKLLNHHITFIDDCIGEKVKKTAADLQPRQIIMLENLRFYPGEDDNDPDFAKHIVEATKPDIFVQDCFASAHHIGASIDAITHLLPSVAGLSLEKEVDTIMTAMQEPKRPLMAIIGGAKVADKIRIIERFIEIADIVAIGGALANPFLMAEHIPIGASVYDSSEHQIARSLLKKTHAEVQKRPFVFVVPRDVIVAEWIGKTAPTRLVDLSSNMTADVMYYPKRVPTKAGRVGKRERILDIGPFSAAFIAGGVQLAKTVIWNGTLGVTETPSLDGPVGPTAHGTEIVIEALLGDFGHKPYVIIGGGDTVGYIESRNLIDAFGHVSTGGGASLELMAGNTLPGVAALMDKK